MKTIIIDALARSRGKRLVVVDVIGIGPRAVAGILLSTGIKAQVYPAEIVLQNPNLLGQYDVLMVSAMTTDKLVSRKILELWRKFNNGPAIIGGPITAEAHVVSELGYDIGVYGEAEESLPKLMSIVKDITKEGLSIFDSINDQKIPGVIFNHNGRIIFHGRPRYVPRDKLNYFQPPSIENYPLYWASRVYVEVVRGCSNFKRPTLDHGLPSKCIKCPICFDPKTPLRARLKCPVGIPAGCGYCSVPELYGPARSRSINIIVREVKELVKKGVTKIVLSAPDFLDYGRDLGVLPDPLTDPCYPPANLEAIRELLENLYDKISEFKTKDAYLMIENIKACLVDEKVASLLGEFLSGTPVHIGAESGDNSLLRKLGRPSTTNDVIKAVKLLSRNGLEPYVYFIYALPGETKESVKKTIRFMREIADAGAAKLNVYRFLPLPGTAFANIRTVVKDYDMAIKMEAKKLNEKLKLKLIGKKYLAIISGYHKSKKLAVAYPLPHGPVIYLNTDRSLIGWLVKVRIVGVESDRGMYGILVDLVKKLHDLKPEEMKATLG